MVDVAPHIARVGHEEFAFLEPHQTLPGFELVPPGPARELLRRVPPWMLRGLDRGGRAVADLVAFGHLVLARRRLVRAPIEFPVVSRDLSELVEESEEAPSQTEAAPDPTFAAFRLIDDRGEPVSSRAFTLDLPDGRSVEGTTGADGRFEVDPVDAPGNCVLRFDSEG